MDVHAGRHGVAVLKLTRSKTDVKAKGTTRRLPCPCRTDEPDAKECPAKALFDVIERAMQQVKYLNACGCNIVL